MRYLHIITLCLFFIACKNTHEQTSSQQLHINTSNDLAEPSIPDSIFNEITNKHIQIPGTRVFIIPPPEFELDTVAMSLVNKDKSIIQFINIDNGNFEKNTIDLTPEGLTRHGHTIIKYKNMYVNGYIAKYAETKTSIDMGSYLLAWGDSTFCCTVTSIYPFYDKKISEEIKKSLLSIVYDKTAVIDPLATAIYTIETQNSKYKFSELNVGHFIYTVHGKKFTPNDNSIAIQQASVGGNIDYQTIMNEVISSFQRYGLSEIKTINTNSLSIHGNNALEQETYGILKGKNVLLYSLIIGNPTSKHILIISCLINSDFNKNLVDVKNVAHTLRFK